MKALRAAVYAKSPGPAVDAGTLQYLGSEDAKEAVTLTFRDSAGRKIVSYASDTKDASPARKPGTKAGLNRFVWDMKYPGPTKLDYGLAPPRPKPLVPDPENPPGPTVVPVPVNVWPPARWNPPETADTST